MTTPAPRTATAGAPGGPAGPGGPGQPSRSDAIRTAALDLFAERGYRPTTMADIGERAGIRGPSIYKHFGSKQQLLAEIMSETMHELQRLQRAAVESTDDTVEQVRRAVEAHVRYHARHRHEAFVGNREIGSLDEPARGRLLRLRGRYERRLRSLIQHGMDDGVFTCRSAQLASFALLDMGMGIAAWYRQEGPTSEDELVYHYGDLALRVVGARR